MTARTYCPQCGDPLLVYEADAGRYLGCPECLWMGMLELSLSEGDQQALGEVLDEVAETEVPDWMLRDIEEPPRRD